MLMCGIELFAAGWVLLGAGCLDDEPGHMGAKIIDGEIVLRCIPPEELKDVTSVAYPPCPEVLPPEPELPSYPTAPSVS